MIKILKMLKWQSFNLTFHFFDQRINAIKIGGFGLTTFEMPTKLTIFS